MGTMFTALLVVVVLELVGVLVVRQLHQLGLTSTTFDGLFEKGGGTVRFSGTGVLAAFVIIDALGILAVYVLAR
jgi:hypothetical protein